MPNKNKSVKINELEVSNLNPFILIAGPCVIESKDHAFYMVEKIQKICSKVGIKFIYKSCYDKDCRSSIKSFHGIGIEIFL